MENKHTRSVSLIDGHIEETDVIKALECCINDECEGCPLYGENHPDVYGNCVRNTKRDALDLINRLQAKNKELDEKLIIQKGLIDAQKAEIERLNIRNKALTDITKNYDWKFAKVKAEAIKEFAEKIDELFRRYAHLHFHADCARADCIKVNDGTEIEMRSVWDVFTLKKYGIAEYEEMKRLQSNIEVIDKERLLAELEKDFRVLVKEMTEVSE